MSKIWFVTGSSRGLGRNYASLDELVAGHSEAVLPLELDVTDKAAVFASVKRAREHFGRLDVIVNNAGDAQVGAIEEMTEQELRDQLETNLFGALWVIQAALPYLREQGVGHIIQLSSAAGRHSSPSSPPPTRPCGCSSARASTRCSSRSKPTGSRPGPTVRTSRRRLTATSIKKIGDPGPSQLTQSKPTDRSNT